MFLLVIEVTFFNVGLGINMRQGRPSRRYSAPDLLELVLDLFRKAA